MWEILHQSIIQRNKEALWQWIDLNLGIKIPRVKVCKDHDAPFDFVCDIMFGDVKFAVVLANRSGGKTENFAILDTLLSFYYAGVEIATVGAIKFQAEKCYKYFKEFSAKFPFNVNLADRTMHKTNMKNGSEVQVLTGTMSGVNSPHPQILFVDEIDLMAWAILQQALSMPQSKNGVPSITVLTSTRKFAGGAMQRLMDEAPKKGYKVYQWCIWETIKKLPDDPKRIEEIKNVFGEELPNGIVRANGYYDWQDAINKKMSPMEVETWEVEWLCKRPGLEGVIYGSSYSDDNNLITEDWTPVGKDGYIVLLEDFGFGMGHPDVVLFMWIPLTMDRAIIFDELYMNNYGTEQIWDSIMSVLKNYGHRLADKIRNIAGTVWKWYCDYHGLTEIADRKAKGAPIEEKAEDSALYLVNNGIVIVGKLLSSGRLMITANCVNLRTELLSYKRQKNLDGTYSKEPKKVMDHGPDAIRYWAVKFGPTLMARINDIITAEVRQKEDIPIVIRDNYQRNERKPITAGIWGRKL